MGKSNIIIGTAPCSWGVWYPDGKPSGTPWELFLDQATEAGYKELELGPVGYLPKDNDQLAQELNKRDLKVCSGTCVYIFDQMKSFEDKKKDVEELCTRLNKFDAKYLVVMDESSVGDYSEKKGEITGAQWNNYLKMFNDMGEFTKNEFGISTVFHPHIRTLIETEKEIEMLLSETSLDLCYDLGHHAYVNGGVEHGDASALIFMEKHKDRVPYLHFKNVSGKIRKKVADENLTSHQAFDIDVMCPLEDGIIDYTQVRDLLDKIAYNGIAIVETDLPRATSDEAFAIAKQNLQYLKRINLID